MSSVLNHRSHQRILWYGLRFLASAFQATILRAFLDRQNGCILSKLTRDDYAALSDSKKSDSDSSLSDGLLGAT